MPEENITHPANVHRKQGESTNWCIATWHELAAAGQYRSISSEGIQGHLAQKRAPENISHMHAWLLLELQLTLQKADLILAKLK